MYFELKNERKVIRPEKHLLPAQSHNQGHAAVQADTVFRVPKFSNPQIHLIPVEIS